MKTYLKFKHDVDCLTETLKLTHRLSILECTDDLEEDEGGSAPTTSAGSGNVAGIGIARSGDPQFAEPGVPNRKKLKYVGNVIDPRMFAAKIFKRGKKAVAEEVETHNFAGTKVFVVDPDMYSQCRLGKNRYHQWSKYVGDSEVGKAISEFGKTNPKEAIIVQNAVTGDMMYLRNQDLHNWKEK
jgi:hypothetical protein